MRVIFQLILVPKASSQGDGRGGVGDAGETLFSVDPALANFLDERRLNDV